MHDTHDLTQPQADLGRDGQAGENGVLPLYTRLRKLILDGAFPPGSMLSQVKLAESLGVSRILLWLYDDAEVDPFIEAAEDRRVPLTVLELRGEALEERYGARCSSCDPTSMSPGAAQR